MKYKLLILTVLASLTANAGAQQNKTTRTERTARNIFLQNYEDSLRNRYKQLFNIQDSTKQTSNADMPYQSYRLFSPLVFYNAIIGSKLAMGTEQNAYSLSSIADNALLNIYLKRPELVQSMEKKLHSAAPDKKVTPTVIKTDLGIKTEKPVPLPTEQTAQIPVDVVVMKPNFWAFKGDYYLQFLQNYVSGNWYKGGESNYSMVGSVTLQLNYNNKQKVKWDNKLELKLGFVTSKSDSLHSLKTSEDLIRYTGKLGLQASKQWYYTMQLVAYTQFLRGYGNNSRAVFSDFMSPLNTNLSLGMDYNVKWFKSKLTGSIHLAPLAYNFRYVDRVAVAPRYGLKPDKHTLHDFGSEFTFDLLWKMSDLISWQTRLYGYTTYSRAEVEWENTFTFKFNKYISSKLFVYPRFDDGTARDGHHGYWQLREFASIGFSYTL